jgi:hypothetical protein
VVKYLTIVPMYAGSLPGVVTFEIFPPPARTYITGGVTNPDEFYFSLKTVFQEYTPQDVISHSLYGQCSSTFIYKDLLKIRLKNLFFYFLRYLVFKLMHTCIYKKRFFCPVADLT